MATIADLMIKIGVDHDLEAGVGGAADVVDRNFAKISAAGVAGGAALEGFARSQQDSNVQTRQLAASLGMSEGAMRDLATETANVTFPIEDVLDLMETGKQRGIEGAAALQEYATFWDTVGDATGESATELGAAAVALEAVGISAGEEEEALGALGFITESTTGSVSDFLKFVERTGPELRGLGADVDDAAAILGILESEFGMSGRTARQEFRSAVGEADGDMEKLLDTLGISEDQFAGMRDEVESSSGIIQRNADVVAESFTPMQKLQHEVEELMFEYGGLADAAGALALPLMALGPVSKIVSAGMKGSIAAGKGVGKALRLAGKGAGSAIGAFGRLGSAALTAAGQVVTAGARMAASAAKTAAKVVGQIAIQVAKWVVLGVQSLLHAAKVALAWMISLGPIALVIAAVVGLVALIIANWDKITAAISAGWRFVKRITSTVWNAIVGFFTEIPGRIIGAVTALVGMYVGFWKRVLSTGFNVIKTVVTSVVDFYRRLPGRILDAIASLASKIASFFRRVMTGARNAVVDRFNAIRNFFTGIPGKILRALGNLGRLLVDAGRSIMDGLLQGLKDSFGKVTDFAGSIGGKIKDLKGPLPEDARLLVPEGSAIIEGLGAGMDDEMARLERQVVAFAERITKSAAIDPLAVNDFDTPRVPGMAHVGGGGGGDTVNIYPQGSILAERDVVEIVRNEMNRGGFRGSFR